MHLGGVLMIADWSLVKGGMSFSYCYDSTIEVLVVLDTWVVVF